MKEYLVNGIKVHQYIFEFLDSNMYILLEGKEAIVIDPHKSIEAINLLKKNTIERVWILLTHEHTDHTSGIYIFQEEFDCTIVCQQECAKHISNIKKVRPLLIYFTLEERDRKYGTNLLSRFQNEFVLRTYEANITFDKDFVKPILNHIVKFIHIPGHSKGSCLICIDDSIAFTGDSLMNEHPIITRFPGSNQTIYKEYTIPILESLNKDTFVLPGHGFGFRLDTMYRDGHLHIEYM